MPSVRRYIGIVVLVSCCISCGERSTEYRLRSERARVKVNTHDDLAENNGYSKYRDRLWRKRHVEDQERHQEEAARTNRAKQGIKDGSLMEKYTLAPGQLQDNEQ